MNPHAPPRIGDWLLNALLPESDREVMAGDLAEEYSIRDAYLRLLGKEPPMLYDYQTN
jgi:hypothetical protein